VQEGGSVVRRLGAGLLAPFGLDARVLVLSFAICAGAVLYFSLAFEPDLRRMLTISAGTLTAWLLARRFLTSDILICLFAVLFGVSLGVTAGCLRSAMISTPTITEETGPVMLEGWVQDVEPGRKGVRLLIQVHAIANTAEAGRPQTVRLTHTSRLEVAPGRFVRCWAVLRPPPGPSMPGEYDFRRQAWFEGLGAVGYVQGRCRGGVLGAPGGWADKVSVWLGAARRSVALEVNEAAGERAGGFAAALVSGDRSLILPADDEALRDTGLTHIVSISGLHLTIVGGLVFLLVKRALAFIEPIALRVPVQKPAAIAALLACTAYIILSGYNVPAIRALIMAAIVFGAILIDRAPISLRTFAIALIAIVLFQPESVVTPGFQMSFAATGALVTVYEIWRVHRSGREFVLGPISTGAVSTVATSLAAGLATMPFILFHFDRATPVGFVANLAATPIMTFLTAPSAAVALLLAPFGASDYGLRVFGFSLELILEVAHFFAPFSDDPRPSLRPMPPVALALSIAALATFMTMSGLMRLIGPAVFTAASLIAWSMAPSFVAHWSPSGDVYVAQPDGEIGRVPLEKGEGLSPLRFAEVAEAPCEEQACQFTTPAGISLALQGAPEPRLSLSAATGSGPPLIYAWPDVEQESGVSLYEQRGDLRIRRLAPCGQRPWHPCQAPPIPTKPP
jgi:competence protein ComEC